MRPPTIELKALEQSADIDHHRLLICTTQCHFGREGIGVWGLDCPPQSAQQSYSPTELGPRERAAVFAASAARGGNFSSSEMPRRREGGRECTVCSTSSSMWTKVLHAAQPVIAVVGVGHQSSGKHNFKFGATSKPPASTKNIQYRPLNMWVNLTL